MRQPYSPLRPESRPGSRRASSWVVRVGLAMGICLLAAGLVGCSGGKESGAGGDEVRATTAEPVRVRTLVTRIAGRLSHAQRRRLTIEAGSLVQHYVTTAFGTRPPAGGAAFPGFTPGARRKAVADRRVLSGGARLAGAEQVVARQATAYVAVFTDHGRPAGATARLELDLRVTGPDGATTPVRLRGRLLLTPTPDGWRIFGYDLARSDRTGGGAS